MSRKSHQARLGIANVFSSLESHLNDDDSILWKGAQLTTPRTQVVAVDRAKRTPPEKYDCLISDEELKEVLDDVRTRSDSSERTDLMLLSRDAAARKEFKIVCRIIRFWSMFTEKLNFLCQKF